jgi:pimeloyl-ACP methyl ester carboxylesterase
MSMGLVAAARLALASTFVAAMSSAGWAQSPEAAVKPRGGAHVYLFRGFTGMFSQGMDEIGGKLRRRGVNATVHAHFAWGAQAAEAIADYRSGRTRTIILVGHSMGGPSTISMANELARARVPVALIVMFDPVGSLVAPPNVQRTINYYVSGGFGVTVAGTRGKVINEDEARSGLGHVGIQYSEAMQMKAVGNVLAAIGAGAPRRAPTATARPAADPNSDVTTTSTVSPASPQAVGDGETTKQ